jgi:hypothetical protein
MRLYLLYGQELTKAEATRLFDFMHVGKMTFSSTSRETKIRPPSNRV